MLWLCYIDCLYVAILGFVSGISAAKGEHRCPSLCSDSDLVFSLVNAPSESEISGLSMFPQMACKVAMVFHGFVSQCSLVAVLWGIPLFCFFHGRSLFVSGYFILSEWIRRSYVQSYVVCWKITVFLVGYSYSVGDKV